MHLKLQTRIVAYFTILLLLVIGVFAVFFDVVVSRRFEAMASQNVVQLAIKLSQHVDSDLHEMDQVSKSFATNEEVLAILSDIARNGPPKNSYMQLLASRTLDGAFARSLAVTSIPTCSVYLYDTSGAYRHSFNGRQCLFDAVMQNPANREALANWQRLIYAAVRDLPSSGPTRLLSLVRPVFSLSGIQYGYVEIQDEYTELQKICDVGSTGQVMILDAQHREVYPLDPGKPAESPRVRLGSADSPAGTFPLPGGYLCSYAWSDYSGFTVFVKERESDVLGPLAYLRTATYATILLVTIFALAMVYVISVVLMQPIRTLRDSVLHVSLDNMKLNMDVDVHNDEIQLLSRAFQDMLERLKEAIDKAMLANREEMRARFGALQARIAPHFIHNVLYLISVQAHEKRTDDVEMTCKKLSDMLRYVVQSPFKTVTIADEVTYASDYLSLQKQNYEDYLSYTVRVEPLVRSVTLPRLVIQPFVENSIHNGFKTKLPPWKIDVACEAANERWCITISDNGCGIDEATIRHLRERMAAEQDESGAPMTPMEQGMDGMAIINTYGRLRLMYGDLLGFDIRPNEEGGTTVCLSGPLLHAAVQH